MDGIREIFTNAFSGFGITDAVDIILVAFVVYGILNFIVKTRAEQILKGCHAVYLFTVKCSDDITFPKSCRFCGCIAAYICDINACGNSVK